MERVADEGGGNTDKLGGRQRRQNISAIKGNSCSDPTDVTTGSIITRQKKILRDSLKGQFSSNNQLDIKKDFKVNERFNMTQIHPVFIVTSLVCKHV